MKTILITITVALLLIGCQSNPTSPQSNQSIQTHEYDRIQKESDGSYSVIIDGKVKYTELKYNDPHKPDHLIQFSYSKC